MSGTKFRVHSKITREKNTQGNRKMSFILKRKYNSPKKDQMLELAEKNFKSS